MTNLFSKPSTLPLLSLGTPVVNYILTGDRDGGVPVGRMTEIYGLENAGKSTLGYTAIKSAQTQGGLGVLIETENALPSSAWLEANGVDVDALMVFQPSHVGEVLNKIIPSVLSAVDKLEAPSVIVWDSVASTNSVGNIPFAQSLAEGASHLHSRIHDSNCALIMINQVRFVPDVGEVTIGGRTIKLAYTIRLRVESAEQVGNHAVVCAKCTKSELIPPGGRCWFAIDTDDSDGTGGVSHFRSVKATFDKLELFRKMGEDIFVGWRLYTQMTPSDQWALLKDELVKVDF